MSDARPAMCSTCPECGHLLTVKGDEIFCTYVHPDKIYHPHFKEWYQVRGTYGPYGRKQICYDHDVAYFEYPGREMIRVPPDGKCRWRSKKGNPQIREFPSYQRDFLSDQESPPDPKHYATVETYAQLRARQRKFNEDRRESLIKWWGEEHYAKRRQDYLRETYR